MKDDDKTIAKKGYRGHKKSVLGTFSLALGLLVFIILIALVLMSRSDDEVVVARIGGFALYDMLLSICGMVISAKAVKEYTAHYIKSLIGIILNTGVFFGLVCMYLIGI